MYLLNILFSLQIAYTEAEMSSIRGELRIVQKALKLQTKRCRQLVAEYTKKLQEKEVQYQTEKSLRDDQLAKVLRALLIVEARLRQEQKYINHQLNEKDYIIKKQKNDIKKLLASQYCKSCNQYCVSSPNLESLDSSSEYALIDYQDYHSSNFESLDSSSENYATLSEKSCNKLGSPFENISTDDTLKSETESTKNLFQKNRNKDSLGRRSRKVQHRKSVGTYFEVLKLRNANSSPLSNEDNTSNDYDNLDSLPPESTADKISLISENIDSSLDGNEHSNHESESSPTLSLSDCMNTVINTTETGNEKSGGEVEETKCKISETIPVFEGGEESNDIWYASASDQEDEEHRDVYRNNPVLECMHQILLQNMNDSLNSPPKTPSIERKSLKHKRVKFCDEEEKNSPSSNNATINTSQNYYETPIQKQPNFYETPQSIYSNDYEQILSKCGESPSNTFSEEITIVRPGNHQYIPMEIKSDESENKIVRKSKILRAPPALPPKPANLTAKYKKQNITKKIPSEKSDDSVTEFEPDYCSISELNIPQTKIASFKKISVVAEINAPTSFDVLNKLNLQPEIDSSTITGEEIQKSEKENDIDKMAQTISLSPIVVESKKDGIHDVDYNISNSNCDKDSEGNQGNLESNIKTLNNVKPIRNTNNIKNLTSEQKFAENKHITEGNNKSNIVIDDNNMSYIMAKPISNEPKRQIGHAAKMDILGKMYFSNDANVNILGQKHSNEFKLNDKIKINDTLVVKKCVEKLNIQLAKNTSIKSDSCKKTEMEIPKLPQVSEIIIPDEGEEKDKEERISHDNYVKNNSQIFKLPNNCNDLTRRPIIIGSSVSSLISGFNQQLLSELNKRPERNKVGSHLFSSFENKQNSDKQVPPAKQEQKEDSKFDNFDLSQNFEEFKLDDCELEEYTVEENFQNDNFINKAEEQISVTPELVSNTRVELIRARNDIASPKLNRKSIELLKKQIELQKNQTQFDNALTNDKINKNNEPTYEHFLECTGLSSKSILTPSRMLSNHKSMLKPKDVKLRSKVRTNANNFERHSTSSVKYWSEPYI